jgi:hypothetical protein
LVATRRLNGSKVNRIQASALRPVFSKLARGDYPDNGCFAPNPNVLLCDRECPLHVEPGQTDWVLTLKRADIDENTCVLNKRAKSRPQLAAVSEQGGAYSPVAFLCAHAAGRHPPLVPDHAQRRAQGRQCGAKGPRRAAGVKPGRRRCPIPSNRYVLCADRNTKEIQTARLYSEKTKHFLDVFGPPAYPESLLKCCRGQRFEVHQNAH